MNAILKLQENNFENKELVPEVFSAKVEGTQVLKITTTWNSETLTFFYDLKNNFEVNNPCPYGDGLSSNKISDILN